MGNQQTKQITKKHKGNVYELLNNDDCDRDRDISKEQYIPSPEHDTVNDTVNDGEYDVGVNDETKQFFNKIE